MRLLSHVAAALALAALAAAFGTINSPIVLGQHNEHEMITRLAFQCPDGGKSDGICFEPRSLDQLAGYHVTVMGVAVPGGGFNGAVGAPDTLDPVPEGPEAHCDDADFFDAPDYPQSRAEATAKLQTCVDHLRERFRQGVEAAGSLLDERQRIRPDMVGISGGFPGDCTFAFPSLQSGAFGRAKCSALEGFGRALHGIQDFYAHSNWADQADPSRPIGVSNPPGLGMKGTAPFLGMRANGTIPPDQIPFNLTTGCFSLPDTEAGSGECEGRVTHYSLSKDKGIIHADGTFGEPGPGPRSLVADNFRLAVEAAVLSSRDAWAELRDELRQHYGTVSGDLMICALVRDNPVTACRNRTLAIAVDNSAASKVDGAVEVERLFALELVSRLTTDGLDRVAVLEYNEEAHLVYPMGPPMRATFDLSEPRGHLSITGGLELGIEETIKTQPETYADRGAVLLLATAPEAPETIGATLVQLKRALEEGIRVHYACITMPERACKGGAEAAACDSCSPANAIVPSVLKTGGIAAFIDSPSTKAPEYFAHAVMERGLTATDEEEEGASAEDTRLYHGITLAGVLRPEDPAKAFMYPALAGEKLNVTIGSVAPDGHGAEGCFTITLWNNDFDFKIATHTRCGCSSPLSLAYQATTRVDLGLVVEYGDTVMRNELLRREEIVFTVALDTDMPEREEPTRGGRREPSSSTSADRDSKTAGAVDVPGVVVVAKKDAQTSETPFEMVCGGVSGGRASASVGSQGIEPCGDGASTSRLSSGRVLAGEMPANPATITMASNFTAAGGADGEHEPCGVAGNDTW